MTLGASIAVVVAAMLAPDRIIEAKLHAIQAQLSSNADPPPPWLRYDDHTVIAGFRWQDELGPNGIIVAYRATPDGALHRVSTYKYGDSPRSLDLVEVARHDAPQIVVTGTNSPLEILAWDGKHLEEIGEASSNAKFVDVDGNGIAEVVEPGCCATNECGAPLQTPVVRRPGEDGLVDVDIPGLQDVLSFTKTTDEPETFEAAVALEDDASTACVLHIVKHRTTAIEIDGRPATAADERIAFPSRCANLTVTVSGPAGARVVILVLSSRA